MLFMAVIIIALGVAKRIWGITGGERARNSYKKMTKLVDL
jgi:hypothetical protein